jgi:addiction module HigA family antidote
MDISLSPIHPGEVLLEDFMKPLGLTQYRLAHDIGVTPIRISQIVNGQRAISVDTAMRLARYFGTSATVWLRLQVRYDLEVSQGQLSDRINREVKVFQQPSGRAKALNPANHSIQPVGAFGAIFTDALSSYSCFQTRRFAAVQTSRAP